VFSFLEPQSSLVVQHTLYTTNARVRSRLQQTCRNRIHDSRTHRKINGESKKTCIRIFEFKCAYNTCLASNSPLPTSQPPTYREDALVVGHVGARALQTESPGFILHVCACVAVRRDPHHQSVQRYRAKCKAITSNSNHPRDRAARRASPGSTRTICRTQLICGPSTPIPWLYRCCFRSR